LALALGLVVGGCNSAPEIAPPPQRVPLRVAAASDLKFALEELATRFEAANPTIDVTANYGSSGNLYALLTQKAPFSLFLSANTEYAEKLVAEKHAIPESLFSYAVGKLILWVPENSKLDIEGQGLQVLLQPEVKKIAIATPEHAPYGRAAEAALKSQGLLEQVKNKLVIGDNVAQAAQFAVTGAADVALVARSLVEGPAMKGKGRYIVVPPEAYPPLVQSGVVMTHVNSFDMEAAAKFRHFLLSPEGQELLKKYGFDIPSAQPATTATPPAKQ
jgi:molybdate transport system substrate-binding protein